jgi:zinc transport system permease protein
MEFFQYQFMRNAFYAAIMVGLITGILSFFIYHKKLSFIGVGIAHISFGGLALGVLLNIFPYLIAVIFSTGAALGIAKIGNENKNSEDSAIGAIFSFSMAAGVLFLSIKKGYTNDITGYLFGDILAVNSTDIILLSIVMIIVMGMCFIFLKEFIISVFDYRFGTVIRYPVKFFYYFLIVMISVAIVVSIKAVGVILIEGLIVIPGAASNNFFKGYKTQILFSVMISVTSIIAGLIISDMSNLPSGAVIIVVLFSVYIFSIVYKSIKR